ncbi:Hpt domain-containing protein [Thalassospira sp.]|uniref:Hpt domain-containing protein n=1 Tax=Thalassospira sp. TaxID=1912094 RepID=UPI003AA9D5E4
MSVLDEQQRADLQSKLAALRESYAQSIPAKRADIAQKWTHFYETNDQQKLSELIDVVHKLAGTAKTYGFAEIGVLASDLEDALLLLQEDIGNSDLFRQADKVARKLNTTTT